jgi:ATP-dependent Lon protease
LTVSLWAENDKDLDDLPEEIRSRMEFHLVNNMDEVIKLAMEGVPPTAATIGNEVGALAVPHTPGLDSKAAEGGTVAH